MDVKKLRKGYNGYALTNLGRSDLLAHVTPKFSDVVAHHVTHEFGVYESLPPDATSVRVIAEASNDLVQAVVVKVNGVSEREYGDSFYHITVSVNRATGGKANDSNALIKNVNSWEVISPFSVDVTPAFFPF